MLAGIRTRIKVSFLLIICLLVVSLLFFLLFASSHYPRYTEDIELFGSSQFPLDRTVFVDFVPSSAEIVTFSYYSSWDEVEDIYLELEFGSVNEMTKYLSSLKCNSLEYLNQYSANSQDEWFIVKPNIYDNSYTDLFCTFWKTYQAGDVYTGYTIEPYADSSAATYSCNFASISYSYTEMTVIQTSVHGRFSATKDNHIPKYFQRFNVQPEKSNQRLFYF